jgi:hypothetical protein
MVEPNYFNKLNRWAIIISIFGTKIRRIREGRCKYTTLKIEIIISIFGTKISEIREGRWNTPHSK